MTTLRALFKILARCSCGHFASSDKVLKCLTFAVTADICCTFWRPPSIWTLEHSTSEHMNLWTFEHWTPWSYSQHLSLWTSKHHNIKASEGLNIWTSEHQNIRASEHLKISVTKNSLCVDRNVLETALASIADEVVLVVVLQLYFQMVFTKWCSWNKQYWLELSLT